MAFPRECYDSQTLDFMTRVLESAWHDVETLTRGRNLDYTALHTVMSVRIMAGVRDGQSDPEYLKQLALKSVAYVFEGSDHDSGSSAS
jgi:hypothetical protein